MTSKLILENFNMPVDYVWNISQKEGLIHQKEIQAAIVSAIIATILLGIVLSNSHDQAGKLKVYNVNFNGATTFKNDELTVIVQNNPNNTDIVSIYGLNDPQNYSIFPTYLTDKKGNEVDLKNGDFKLISNADPVLLKISLSSNASGSYDGWVLVRSQKSLLSSFPITAETQPLIMIATLWVLVGIFVSLTLWELIKYVKRKEAECNKKKLEQKADEYIVEATRLHSMPSTRGIRVNYFEIDRVEALAFETLQESALWGQIAAGFENRWSKWKSFVKILILEFGSISFGIAIGFLGIYNNASVTNMLVIGVQEIAILLGLGLGIGSLKEFVDKPT
jgi:hypothetical protein